MSVTGAFAFATVLPVRTSAGLGRGVITALPVVGVALGALAGAVVWASSWAFGAGSPLGGALAVAVLLIATRGLHIDGLSDTADALGCYGPPERALQVMRDGSAGPVRRGRRGGGDPAAGAGVRGTERRRGDRRRDRGPGGRGGGVPAVGAGGAGQLAGCDAPRAPNRPRWCWPGSSRSRRWRCSPIRAGGRARWRFSSRSGAATALVAHCVRRFGGITGDVLGAAIEVTTTVAAVGLAIG